MLAYNALAAAYFVVLGIGGEFVGVLLWPAAIVHAVLAVLLARTWFGHQVGRRTAQCAGHDKMTRVAGRASA